MNGRVSRNWRGKDMRTTSGSWRVAKDFPNLPAWIVKSVGGSTVHWPAHRFVSMNTNSGIAALTATCPAPTRWTGPITLAEMDALVRQGRGQDGRDAHQRHPRLPGNNNFKVLEAGARKLGYKEVHTGRMAINSEPRDGRGSASRLASVSRAANPARNGRRSTQRYPRGEATGNLEVRP